MKAFEEWYGGYSIYWGESTKTDVKQHIDVIEAAYRAGYDAGVANGMLRAAEIAEAGFQSAMADKRHVYNYNAGRCDAANAIRKEAGE